MTTVVMRVREDRPDAECIDWHIREGMTTGKG